MKNAVLIILMALASSSFGQSSKVETVKIQTTAECGDCKDRIEGKLNYTKGIKFADLDLDTKIVEVKYKTAKISLDEIKHIISEIGYGADEVPANPESVKKLPACCQPGGMKK